MHNHIKATDPNFENPEQKELQNPQPALALTVKDNCQCLLKLVDQRANSPPSLDYCCFGENNHHQPTENKNN